MDENSDDGLPSGHVGTRRLIAYREGTLPEAEREALQEHLSLCARCTGLLRDLRDFEAAAAGAVETGPEPLRQEAWESLVRRLPRLVQTPPAVRPIATLPAARRRPIPSFVYAVAAALLLAVIGLSIWSAVMVRQERRRLAGLEQRLKERESALAAAQRSLAETERQLQAARARVQDLQKPRQEAPDTRATELEARIAELTADLEKLRRTPRPPGGHDRITAGPRQIDLSVAPRFALRGQEPGDSVLRGGGAANPVRQADRVTLAVDLSDHPVHPEYRFELMDQDGKVLWAGRRPGRSLLGDAGTTLSVSGLAPGSYRLRIEGLSPDRTELLGEYLLEVKAE
ncbi:MAG TPA: zf-HC2 domain-containing protein [Thermoanaerobaculia bacterium]|nr:zf-HC2 domain-containing protein [Thermoanaerobaculia bacterium]